MAGALSCGRRNVRNVRMARNARIWHDGRMADDNTLTDDGDDRESEGFDLSTLDFIAEAEAQQPAPARGHVDITGRLSDGTVWRVASFADGIRLTIAGEDGGATAPLAPGDVDLLTSALSAAQQDVRKARNGWDW